MSTLATALKEEIRRLARKEIRAQTGRTSRAVAQYRREIARLKRQQRDYDKKLAYIAAQTQKSASAAPAEPDLNGSNRFSARSVRAQRRRSGLSASDYAKLVGVSPLTVYNWEHNKSRPRQSQFVALISLRGLGKREAKSKLDSLASGAKRAASRSRRGRPRRAK
jgi:DNA-binding transcriptional regulator YiaG